MSILTKHMEARNVEGSLVRLLLGNIESSDILMNFLVQQSECIWQAYIVIEIVEVIMLRLVFVLCFWDP